MIGRYLFMALGAGVAMASLVVALFAVGLQAPAGLWALVPGAIGLIVCLAERRRIAATPIDASRPGIVPGDE